MTQQQWYNLVIAVAGDKGGIGKTLVAYFLAVRMLGIEPLTCLIDCDDDQHSSGDFATDRMIAGVTPFLKVYNISTKNLEKELIEISKQYKIIFIEFGKASKEAESQDRNDAMELAIKLADLILCPLQPSSIDVKAFAKFYKKLPAEIKNVRSIIIPNRVKSNAHLQNLVSAAPTLEHFIISESFISDRLCYQDTLGHDGRTIFDIRPTSNSELAALREFTQLFNEIIWHLENL